MLDVTTIEINVFRLALMAQEAEKRGFGHVAALAHKAALGASEHKEDVKMAILLATVGGSTPESLTLPEGGTVIPIYSGRGVDSKKEYYRTVEGWVRLDPEGTVEAQGGGISTEEKMNWFVRPDQFYPAASLRRTLEEWKMYPSRPGVILGPCYTPKDWNKALGAMTWYGMKPVLIRGCIIAIPESWADESAQQLEHKTLEPRRVFEEEYERWATAYRETLQQWREVWEASR